MEDLTSILSRNEYSMSDSENFDKENEAGTETLSWTVEGGLNLAEQSRKAFEMEKTIYTAAGNARHV